MRFAYFPGCAAKTITREADAAVRAVAAHLGLELLDFPGFSCCGAGVLHEERPNLGLAINARNFALAERDGLDILTICNTCQLTMMKSKQALDGNESLRTRINNRLAEFDLEYTGSLEIRQFLRVLTDDLGLQHLERKVARQFRDLGVAPFYGCHMLRPKDVVGDGARERPLEQLIASVGGRPIDYASKEDCCGFHVMLVNEPATVGRIRRTMADAKAEGAELVVTPCTLCHLTLDGYQGKANRGLGERLDLPVVHVPQLVGLALGIDAVALGLPRHLVPVPEGVGVG